MKHSFLFFYFGGTPFGPFLSLRREYVLRIPMRVVKGDLNGAVSRKSLWRKDPDRRSNFFFSPPAHLLAVTYITEISLHVTLSNQSHSLTLLRLNFYQATD